MPALAAMRFRSSPFVELKRLASLDEGERNAFRELEADPDFYGLFVARPPRAMTIKAAPRETAELFQSLITPARIAPLLQDEEFASDVIDLVLDGILEIESDHGFVSGADALRIVSESVPEAGGALSAEALLHAQELDTNDPRVLSMALYYYNHIPISPFWRTRFAGPDEVLAHIGADRGALRAMLERDWTLSGDRSAWLSWRSLIAPLPANRSDVTYKLYVSPRPEHMGDAVAALVRALTAVPASFKMGNNAAGLLRPDKLVAYFATRDEVDEAASILRRELSGCEAHGVPFTAALDDSGLLSWGVDPPENERALQWLQRNSWRLWVVQRLGGALAVAKCARGAAAVAPWRFALARIQRLGVDVGTWTPRATLWRAA